MSHRNRRNGLAALAIVAGLAGCTVSPTRFVSLGFALGPVTPAQPNSTQARAAIPAAVGPAAASAPRAGNTGTVTVSFASLLPARQRRLFATLADVDHVTVALSPTTGTAQHVTVAKAAITSGQVSATFTNVPVGSASFSVNVFDAANKSIGSGGGTIQITAGNVTTVNATIQLVPQLAPTPTPAPDAGGGSGTTGSGSVQGNITLVDGLTAQPLTLDTTLHVDNNADLFDVVPDSDGTFWATGDNLIHFDRSGNVLTRNSSVTSIWAALKLTSTGDIVVKADVASTAAAGSVAYSTVFRVKRDGTPIATTSTSYYMEPPLAVSANGDAWIVADGTAGMSSALDRIGPDGSSNVIQTGAATWDMVADPVGGGVIVLEDPITSPTTTGPRHMTKYGADGSVTWTVTRDGTMLTPMGVGVAPDGSIWVYDIGSEVGQDFRLLKYDASGKLIGAYPLPAGLGNLGVSREDTSFLYRPLIDASGNVYVLYAQGAPAQPSPYLVKMGSDGSLKGVYYVPSTDWCKFALTDGTGDLMLLCEDTTTQTRSEKFYKLP